MSTNNNRQVSLVIAFITAVTTLFFAITSVSLAAGGGDTDRPTVCVSGFVINHRENPVDGAKFDPQMTVYAIGYSAADASELPDVAAQFADPAALSALAALLPMRSPGSVARLDPIFKTLAPGVGDVERTPGREKLGGTAELGYLHCGQSGAGHFVKMVHNGIEYGVMAAYAEGLNILKHADVGLHPRAVDAETTPLRNPEHYQFEFNLPDVAEVWRRGSVIASWLLDLTAAALARDPHLSQFTGRVSDSGEGRWTILAAIEEGAPAPVLSTALYQRFTSRGEEEFADKLLSAMRFQFGGHIEKK